MGYIFFRSAFTKEGIEACRLSNNTNAKGSSASGEGGSGAYDDKPQDSAESHYENNDETKGILPFRAVKNKPDFFQTMNQGSEEEIDYFRFQRTSYQTSPPGVLPESESA